MDHLNFLKKNGLTPDMEVQGNMLGLNWGTIAALVRKYGLVVITLLPEILPLLRTGDWAAVIALILAKLHEPVPAPTPAAE